MFLIIMGDAAEMIALQILGYTTDFIRRICIVGLSLILSFPFLLFRDLASLERMSALSIVSIVIICLVVVVKCVQFHMGSFLPSRSVFFL